jgi:hypothetical protein
MRYLELYAPFYGMTRKGYIEGSTLPYELSMFLNSKFQHFHLKMLNCSLNHLHEAHFLPINLT